MTKPTVSIDNLRGKAQGVTMNPAGQAKPAPKKPSSALPPVIKSQAKPIAKGAPANPKAKVKDPVATITPYGNSVHAK